MKRQIPAERFVTAATLIAAASMLILGAWMRIDPAGFAEWANWPNHEHFLHDAGVFQLAIGLMMVCAVWWRDALAVVLVGFVFANSFHAVNHALDADQGGKSSDPWLLAVLSVLAIAGLVVRLRILRERRIRQSQAVS